jgi:hypothetical protein
VQARLVPGKAFELESMFAGIRRNVEFKLVVKVPTAYNHPFSRLKPSMGGISRLNAFL